MNVLWFVVKAKRVGDGYISSVPSSRIRCLNLFGSIDHTIQVVPLEKKEVALGLPSAELGVSEDDLARCDIAVFGKILAEVIPIFDDLRSRGIPTIIDMCDGLTENNSSRYAHLLRQANQVVSSSETLQSQLNSIGVASVCIPDAQSGDAVPFSTRQPSKKLKLLWFGMPTNIIPVRHVVEQLSEHFPNEIELNIVTNIGKDLLGSSNITYFSGFGDTIDVNLHQWSQDAMPSHLAECDLVIIPSAQDEFYKAKTANRLMTGIWAGKFVVSQPVPSYEEFSEFAILNDSIVEGLKAALNLAPEVREKMVNAGQAYIAENHSVAVRGAQWTRLIDEVSQNAATNPPLRLNLGCGDKILPHYTNVDLVEKTGRQAARCAVRYPQSRGL